MKKLFRKINECRICKSKKLSHVLDIGSICLSNFLSKKNLNKEFIAPLELVLCQGKCNLLQLNHTVNSDLMFKEYWYVSGINQSMEDELQNITDSISKLNILKKNDIVLDIGANDGTLLRSYKNKNIYTTGFEPAINLRKRNSRGVDKIISDYFSYDLWERSFNNKKAKVISAIGMFYDLDDPVKFTSDVEKILHEDGMFVIQMMYLPFFLQRNAFDGICHEHLEYYSLKSLEYLLNLCNLKVIGLDIREHVNEGSARFYIVKQKSSYKFKINKELNYNLKYYRNLEDRIKFDDLYSYRQFKNRIDVNRDKTIHLLDEINNNNQVIHGYAASTKGNTTLQYYKLDKSKINVISDKNSDKWGKYTSGSHIPIVSEKQSRLKKPDYYFVLAWHFIEDFIQREMSYLKDGGKFITPMPELKIIDINNYKSFLKSIPKHNKIFNKEVKFYKNKCFSHEDFRRNLNGVSGEFGEISRFSQIKIIDFKNKFNRKKSIVGNHSHRHDSNQWEILIVISNKKGPQVDFRYKNFPENKIRKKILFKGDVVVIPPGCSLAFNPLSKSVQLIELSNEIYNSKNYITDNLFDS